MADRVVVAGRQPPALSPIALSAVALGVQAIGCIVRGEHAHVAAYAAAGAILARAAQRPAGSRVVVVRRPA